MKVVGFQLEKPMEIPLFGWLPIKELGQKTHP